MLTEQSLASILASGDLGALRRETDATELTAAFKCFHKVLVRDRGIDRLDSGLRLQIIEPKDRLAGIFLVVTVPQIPTWAAFGPMILAQGDSPTGYDLARHFIVQTKAQSTETPVPGPFYPEVMYLPPAERLLALANSHVRCKPTGIRQTNLFSLRGRHTLAAALRATQPQGTTCALFLRALLVAAGDGRFVENPKKLTIEQPNRGHMAYGIGADYPPPGGKGLKEVGRTSTSPTGLKRGDLYYISAAHGAWRDSGHVGIVERASHLGNTVILETIDGGQSVDGVNGWWTTKNKRSFTLHNGGAWKGASAKVTKRTVNKETNEVTVETRQEPRSLQYWVSLREIEAMYERVALMVDGRAIQTAL